MQSTRVKDIFTFLQRCNLLKKVPRYTSSLPTEGDSVADHSWRLTLMVIVVATECKVPIDVSKAVSLALLHDLVEIKTGDVDAYQVISGERSKDDKKVLEERAMIEMTQGLSFGDWIHELWAEYEDQESLEAKFVRALDKLEAFLHIADRGVKAYIPEEFHSDYADQAVEAFDEAVHHFPEVQDLLNIVKADLRKKFEEAGVAWVEGGLKG